MKPEEAVLGLFAKAPRPGTVKTRLVPPLTPEEAAGFARATLLDVWRTLGRVRGAGRRLLYAPADGEADLRSLLGPDALLEPQGEGDLGARLERFLCRASAEGGAAVAVGSDHPGIPAGYLEAALAALAGGADMVFGPTSDGGYYLIGLRHAPPPGLLDGLPWSTERILEATAARARSSGLAVETVSPWVDVDRPEDLEVCRALVREMAARGDPDLPLETASWLRARDLEGG